VRFAIHLFPALGTPPALPFAKVIAHPSPFLPLFSRRKKKIPVAKDGAFPSRCDTTTTARGGVFSLATMRSLPEWLSTFPLSCILRTGLPFFADGNEWCGALDRNLKIASDSESLADTTTHCARSKPLSYKGTLIDFHRVAVIASFFRVTSCFIKCLTLCWNRHFYV